MSSNLCLEPTRGGASLFLEPAKVKFRGRFSMLSIGLPVIPGACSCWTARRIITGPVFRCGICASGSVALWGGAKSRSWGRMIKNKSTLIALERLNINCPKKKCRRWYVLVVIQRPTSNREREDNKRICKRVTKIVVRQSVGVNCHNPQKHS